MWSVVIEFEEQPEHARVDNVVRRLRPPRHVREIRRILHIGRFGIPWESQRALHADLAPVRVALEHVAVFACEHLFVDVLADELVDFAARRPDVAQIDFAPLLIGAERRLGDVDLHRAGDRIGDDQRRRGEIIGAHVGVDAALEIAISREHGGSHEIAVVDRLGNLRRQRAGIADAGGAAETDEVEPELVQILLQAGFGEIFADDLRAGRERGLDPRLDREAFRHRLAGDKSRRDHHARVRGVGARRDRRDHHIAMAERMGAAFDRNALVHLGGLAELLIHRLGKAGS